MRYTKNDIKNIPLTEFMAALGEKLGQGFRGHEALLCTATRRPGADAGG